MSVKLSAVVRAIEIGDRVITDEHSDTFVSHMADRIGETILIESRFDDTLEWFDGIDTRNIFCWHISWLKEFKNVE